MLKIPLKRRGEKLGRIFQLVLELPEFAGVATEWKSMIISSRPLNILNEYSIGIPYLAEGQDEPHASAITYTVKVVTPLSFSVSDLISYLSAVNPGPNYLQKAEIVQVQGL
jgi:eukaryotic translation initiation factor 2C